MKPSPTSVQPPRCFWIARTQTLSFLCGLSLVNPQPASAQDRILATGPLPAVATLMQEVEEHQRTAEAKQKDYLYRQVETVSELDGHGAVKKTEVEEFDIFWLQGVEVRRLVRRDGKDLSPDEQKKESERIDKEVARSLDRRAKAVAQGKPTDSQGYEEVTVSRMLELGSFTNERRESLQGRPTIAVDYIGNPKARTRNAVENAIHEMGGTVWVDEQDRAVVRLEGRFLNNFKVAGGLLINIRKDTSFALQNVKINGEVWLPQDGTINGQARVLLLFGVNGRLLVHDTDYRKFKATSTILPGYAAVDPQGSTPTAPGSGPPK